MNIRPIVGAHIFANIEKEDTMRNGVAGSLTLPRLFLAAALAIALPVAASAGTTVTSFTFSGVTADGRFEGTSSDGCITSVAQVFVTEGRGMETGYGRFNGATAEVYAGAFNICTVQYLYTLSGEAVLSPGQFTFDRTTLGSATLKVTIPANDLVSGLVVNVDVDLTWTAISSAQITRSVEYDISLDGTKYMNRNFGTIREAVASGTVSDGTRDLIPGGSLFGSIEDAKSGYIELTR